MVQTSDQPETAEPRAPRRAPGSRAADPQPRVVTTAVDEPAPASSPPSAPPPASHRSAAPPDGTQSSSSGPARATRPPGASRRSRVRAAPRRTRVIVRKVSPLSVLKFSLLFYLCLMLIVLFAMVIVYGVLSAAGAIDSFETVLGYVFGTGTTSTGGAEPLEIDGGAVFLWGLVGGLVFVAVWSLINVFLSMLYNLISDIIGGVEITLAEKPSH
ncbi:MAG: DUF3566 domain-containing protein [Actinomycetota bacterium]|nr:DUF3566 domain-containing protein [Actinomycetota bacterium]MDH5224935.1 DUF3566 domain-containing protein [Actinomycetota bacterium]MDH5313792.1 DUF3566 domain-containing protein [Actinomycetota bacterium]